VRHLLTHTSGIGHWGDMPEIDICAPMDPARQLDIVRQAPLHSRPGERYYYSSLGYFLLAHIAQRAAETKYATFLAEEIFIPLGMTATFAGNGTGAPRLATPYAAGAPTQSYELDQTNLGAGDVWSTAGDLALWDAAVTDGALLSAESWAASLSGHAPMDERAGNVAFTGYGYGWVTGTVAGQPLYCHTGGNAGFRTLNAVLPAARARVTFLSNDETTDIEAVTTELLSVALAA
jgi:CubicO group peptidase (beta-lactamase class C family)